MNATEYKAYLQTDHWQSFSRWIKARRGSCAKCSRKTRLETHHLTYERLGHELETDVVVICHDCHMSIFHPHREKREGKKREGMSWWRELLYDLLGF